MSSRPPWATTASATAPTSSTSTVTSKPVMRTPPSRGAAAARDRPGLALHAEEAGRAPRLEAPAEERLVEAQRRLGVVGVDGEVRDVGACGQPRVPPFVSPTALALIASAGRPRVVELLRQAGPRRPALRVAGRGVRRDALRGARRDPVRRRRPHVTAAGVAFMFGSGCLHSAYFTTLQRGYAEGDLSVIYPLARGNGAGAVGAGGRPHPRRAARPTGVDRRSDHRRRRHLAGLRRSRHAVALGPSASRCSPGRRSRRTRCGTPTRSRTSPSRRSPTTGARRSREPSSSRYPRCATARGCASRWPTTAARSSPSAP